jgi:hypothetical protein
MARAKSKGSISESSAYGLVSHVRHGRGAARTLSSGGDGENRVRNGVITLGLKREGEGRANMYMKVRRYRNAPLAQWVCAHVRHCQCVREAPVFETRQHAYANLEADVNVHGFLAVAVVLACREEDGRVTTL